MQVQTLREPKEKVTTAGASAMLAPDFIDRRTESLMLSDLKTRKQLEFDIESSVSGTRKDVMYAQESCETAILAAEDLLDTKLVNDLCTVKNHLSKALEILNVTNFIVRNW